MPDHPEGVASLLDTDLYKITMQAAILQHYPDTEVAYRFYNRYTTKSLNTAAFSWLKQQVAKLSRLQIQPDELKFLRSQCSYLPDSYYTFLGKLKLDPEKEVKLDFEESTRALSVDISGSWVNTILYEIPILSLISEAYFRFVDTDWSYDGQKEQAAAKAQRLVKAGCTFSEFGTRRRRDYHTQDLVLQGLTSVTSGLGGLAGTSNVHFAQKYNLKPIGTVAHEWFMGTAAITDDYVNANMVALNKWQDTYGDNLGIALTDTFSTNAFLGGFTLELATSFAGVRQDSGSPEAFAGRIVQFYQDRGIDPATKSIVFSDGLNIDRCIQLLKLCQELDIKCSFGIGTFLTNDFKTSSTGDKSPAMNIVIKLSKANGQPAIKISDEMGKHTGDKELVKRVQDVLRAAEQARLHHA